MIDHVSIGVRDLAASTRFYEHVLATIGFAKLQVLATTVGFGKRYPEFWLNQRAQVAGEDCGAHVCLRALSTDAVDAFYEAALRAGGSSDGAPGVRPEYSERYYAAFIRDPDGNKIEAVTFLRGEGDQ
jgi:catechol 2,3-dioxygenase-like lactoylglutathione lyase family enzyme